MDPYMGGMGGGDLYSSFGGMSIGDGGLYGSYGGMPMDAGYPPMYGGYGGGGGYLPVADEFYGGGMPMEYGMPMPMRRYPMGGMWSSSGSMGGYPAAPTHVYGVSHAERV
eukprot:2037807-Rhodomonas_salina.5